MSLELRKLERVYAIGIFTALYLGMAAVAAFLTQNWEFVFYIIVVLLCVWAALTVHMRTELSVGVLWALSFWGLLHMVGGLVPVPESFPIHGTRHVFYSLWIIPGYLKYDHIVHAFGFGVATWLCWQALRSALRVQYPTSGILLLCVLAGMGLGAFNEVVEFMAVLLVPETNVGGYENTAWDLVSNLVGSLGAAGIIFLKYGRDRQRS